MTLLETHGLAIGYGSRTLARDITLSLEAGTVTCLLGPNGVGKTTLFRTLLGLVPPLEGKITIGGQGLAGLARRDFARLVSYVPQAHPQPFAYSVFDLVLMGRTSHLGMFATPGRADVAAVEEALATLGIAALAGSDIDRISGGQLQLALIARAFAQAAAVIVMDEPTASLDLANRMLVLDTVRALAKRGYAVLLATHEPEQAFAVADKAAVLTRRGRLESGRVSDVLTAERLSDLYGLDLVIEISVSGHVIVAPRAQESRIG